MEECLIDIAKEFTRVYRSMVDASIAMREVCTVRTLYPGILLPPRDEDAFVGRMMGHYGSVLPLDFSPRNNSQIGYMMNLDSMLTLKKEYPHRSDEIEALIDYWKSESTFVKLREEAPKEIYDYLMPPGTTLDSYGYMRTGDRTRPKGAGFISGSYDTRLAGLMPDYHKLVKAGLPGLRKEIEDFRLCNPAGESFYKASLYTLDTVDICLDWYAKAAKKAGKADLSDVLTSLRSAPPASLHAALQLILIFTFMLRIYNYGRLDITLGELLAEEYKKGSLNFEGAVQELIGFYDMIADLGMVYDSRIIIGGVGRPDPEKSDLFALAAIEAVHRCHRVVPVLTLRLSKEQSPELYERGLDAIADGCIYPTLYNDDVLVPGMQKSMHLPLEDAMDYVPLGCGEMEVYHKSVGSPNSTMRFLKALEATLHNGRDGADGILIGLETGDLSEFKTYADLEDALKRQIRGIVEKEIKVHEWNRFRTAKECTLVLQSMLMDDCIQRGKGIFDGGIRYFGANSEGFGLTNAADSLAVIKKLVFDQKKYSLPELVHALDCNFEGYEALHREALAVEKYGNNRPYVDEIKTRIEAFINQTYDEVGKNSSMHYYTVANVNPGGITIGPKVAASADGRYCGEPMALSNSPMPGRDKEGLTAMLLSCAASPADNGGLVTNMNISRESLVHQREKISQAFKVYFSIGGQELNINCFSKGDLEKALKEPQKFSNLIVRVSGYSARFIDLDPITQKHIMERSLF